jgi:hypothetical protein
MAMAACPKCRQLNRVGASSCTHCGAMIPTSWKTAFIVFGLMIAFVAWIFWPNPEKDARDRARKVAEQRDGTKIGALVVCEQFVKQRLKAPGTANLQTNGTSDDAVTSVGAGKYVAKGFYDAQNSFGAMLRGYYTCTVQHTNGDSYRLISMEMR